MNVGNQVKMMDLARSTGKKTLMNDASMLDVHEFVLFHFAHYTTCCNTQLKGKRLFGAQDLSMFWSFHP